jgi:hypothetical protein
MCEGRADARLSHISGVPTAMKWKDVQRVREHVVATTAQRSRKGDAFRT